MYFHVFKFPHNKTILKYRFLGRMEEGSLFNVLQTLYIGGIGKTFSLKIEFTTHALKKESRILR